jgi:SAM-dependent methyltransferase
MFGELAEINKRPKPFEFYTASELWTNEYTSKKMLEFHLNDSIDSASRNISFIDRSVDWMVKHFDINSGSSIIDFGCGPGLYTSRFAKTGAKVTGIDFSQNSLNYAKKEASKNNLNINYICCDYLEFDSKEKYDLITMIMCDYTALSPSQRKKLLGIFHSLLKPDGSIILDVYSYNYFNETQEISTYEFNQPDKFWSADDYYCFVNKYKYEAEKLILEKYTIIEESGKRVIYNWFQCFDMESVRSEFAGSGLKIVDFFSDVAGKGFDIKSNEFAVVAKVVIP